MVAVQQANLTLYERARSESPGARSLPMIIAAVVSDNVLWAVHLGSSRMYLVRADLVSQLSTDPRRSLRRRSTRSASAPDPGCAIAIAPGVPLPRMWCSIRHGGVPPRTLWN